LRSEQPKLPCPQCQLIGTITVAPATPTSRGFAVCADNQCNARIALDQFATTATATISVAELQDLKNTVQLVLSKYQGLEDLTRRLSQVETRNSALAAENAALREELRKAKLQKLPISHNNNNKSTSGPKAPPPWKIHAPPAQGNIQAASQVTTQQTPAQPSWAERTGTSSPTIPNPRSERKLAAAARPFQPITEPQGFQYIYIPRTRRMDRAEVRRRLRKLGMETFRILDITFPTRDVVGLLVHVQYMAYVLDTLTRAKVVPVTGFDPTDPKHLSDPRHSTLAETDRRTLATQIHRTRSIRALQFMKPPIAVAVGRQFLALGWIAEEDIPTQRYQDHDDPANGFRQISDRMSDVCSEIDEQ
jgi:hypothetical protein